MSALLSPPAAWSLVCEWTESDSLRRHMLAVGTALRAYAAEYDGDPDEWEAVGYLHDLDYEQYPDLESGHPRVAMAFLSERDDVPAHWVRAIASHADYLEVSRDSALERALYAVDELCGFIAACAYVRPQGIVGMTPKSVKKKLKTPAFAAAISRADVQAGAEELGVDFDEHVRFVIAALTERAGELGIAGTPA